ncbi:transcription factor-like protein DPB isoform X2 [Tasmannia lanceolata]|uniref:transcription factor-like protein DPB isoform X2 n=1 Tax=Tasmannia lanceolata TaxID=3420 RepID=UPI0040643A44
MGSSHCGDLPCTFDQIHSNSRNVGSTSRGCGQALTAIACKNSLGFKHLDVQGDEDIRYHVAYGTGKKKRSSRIVGGGLRQYSMIVCKKVESKGRTTYSEVADEIIAETAASGNNTVHLDEFYEKNIRRRVYDALNVLMAMDIIAKDKKDIHWKGLPSTNMNDVEELVALRMKLMARIEKKATYLHELEEQVVGLQNLIQRNQQMHKSGNIPAEGVALPFILVQTRPQATVEIEISEDMRLVHFDFNGTPFALHDDAYVLKAMRYCQVRDSGHVQQDSSPCSSSSPNNAGKSLGTTSFSWNSEIGI